ncbi:terpene synthase family protein [Nocardia sp. NPDC004750]
MHFDALRDSVRPRESIVIPDLFCPFPSDVHPHREVLASRTRAWLAEFGILASDREVRRSEQARWDMLVGLMYRRGDVDRVQIASDIVWWYCQYDEAGFERPTELGDPATAAHNMAVVQRVADDPGQELDGADAYQLAWQDVMVRLRQVLSSSQMTRFRHGISLQVLANAWESIYVRANVVPSLADYCTIRRYNSGAGTFLAVLLEMCGGYDLTESRWSQPEVQRLNALVDDIFGYTNDVMAFERELSIRSIPMNLVAILAHHNRLSAQQALDAAAELHRDQTRHYQELSASLRQNADEPLRSYLNDLDYFVAGDQKYYEYSRRYCGTEEFGDDNPATVENGSDT